MKKTLVCLLALILGISGVNAERQAKMKDLRPLNFPSHLQTLNISASSEISYADAMNRLARRTPVGYSISSLQYVRNEGRFVIIAKLVKVI